MSLLLLSLLACLPDLKAPADDTGIGASIDSEDTDPTGGVTDDTGGATDDTDPGGDDTDPGGDDTDPGGDSGDTDPPDSDEDGWPDDEDCDPANSDIHPGAEETCDELDNDCDEAVDEDAVDAMTWYADDDNDGWGDEDDSQSACAAPGGYVEFSGDCDDSDPAYNPTATEDDCSDPNDYNCDGSVGYTDGDGDGWAACEECDDANSSINPGTTERCDDIDNNCDGLVDNDAEDAETWYLDADEDGYGVALKTAEACDQPEGYVDNTDDCDDGDASVSPDGVEECDTVDNDCDVRVDEDFDADGDGLQDCLDSEDCDNRDNDGDGAVDEDFDVDGDGFTSCGTGGDPADCDDGDAAVNPDAEEICDEIDNNCDSVTDLDAVDRATWHPDADRDGFGDPDSETLACDAPFGWLEDASDCDDGDAEVNPDATELCDEVDNDCDTDVDEDGAADAPTWYVDADMDDYGVEDETRVACEAPEGFVDNLDDCDDGDASVSPDGVEECDTVDNDCDVRVDEDFDADGDGLQDCLDSEDCDNRDNDGDGAVDEDFDVDGDGFTSCGTGGDPADCDDGDPAVNPDAEEICNDRIDNDCDETANDCALTGTITAGSADVIFYGDESDDEVGYGIDAAGDVDGDGELDLVIAARHEGYDGDSSLGAAFVVFGPFSGTTVLDETTAAQIAGDRESDELGTVVAGGLNVDGDGYADLLLGSDKVDYGTVEPGAAYLVSGPLSVGAYRMVEDSTAAFYGSAGGDKAGSAVAGADLDGDEVDDVLVGVREWDGDATKMGRVYLFFGPVTGDKDLDTDGEVYLEGPSQDDRAGAGLATGDFDGDGWADLLIGGSEADAGGDKSGEAYLVLGPITADVDLADADLTLAGEAANDKVGSALSLGDSDGDGRDDLLLGTSGYDITGANSAGAAYLVLAASLVDEDGLLTDDALDLGSADALVVGGYADAKLGESVELGGDYDGDGVKDLLLGASGSDEGGDKAGAAYVFYGPLTGTWSALSYADLSFIGDTAGDALGNGVTSAGDVNGDGIDDLLAGAAKEDTGGDAAGAAYLLFGEGL